MKKYIAISLLFLIGVLSVQAQKKAPAKPARTVIINKTNGTSDSYVLSEVDSITFGFSESVVDNLPVPEKKNLGLSIEWATFNLGASSEYEAGTLVGWGDNTLVCKSQKLFYYPTKNPPSTLIGSEYDPAQVVFGDKWRMPTSHEFQELIDSCTWVWDEDNKGYQVTSNVNGESIFLPVAGYRNGEAVSEETKVNGYYWTAMLSGTDTHAKAVVLEEGSTTVKSMERYLGLLIRPVYGEYVVPLTVSAAQRGVAGYTNASIKVSFAGDKKGMTSYGVAYELVPSDPTMVFDFKNASKVAKTDIPALDDVTLDVRGLEEGKQYRALAYAILGSDTVKSPEMVLFTTDARFVDLGLSVKWAKWNIGAESTSEYGGYYGWGDITGEVVSPYANKYAVGNTSTSIAGNANYDIAVAKWGGHWRLPTKAEYEEMVSAAVNAAWTYDASGGVKKYIATFSNGNKLEFPCDGYMNSSCTEKSYDTHGFYWTADATTGQMPYYFHIGGPRSRSYTSAEKYMHLFIRPVYDEGLPPVTPEGPQDDTTAEASPAVDLGLYSGNLWATYNVGAKKETQSGVYVAWGELEEKISEGYYKENYAYWSADNPDHEGYSTALGTNIAGTEYDIAHVRWKGDWQMPTESDMKELRDDCTWTAETRSGVFGYKVTGPNGKSIFLPCAGYYNGKDLISNNSEGNYWCSTMYMFAREYQLGYAMSLGQDIHELSRYSRKGGCTVRPVKHKK